MNNRKIKFYFDFLSPYSYLAWTWVKDAPFEFEYYPVTMATIITHYGGLGPAQIEPKRNYLFKDLLRYTTLNNIPFTTPKNLPFNSLYALRLSLKSVSGDLQKNVIDAIYTAGWGNGLDIGNDDILKEILTNAGLPTSELFIKMEDKNSRIELKKNVENALALKLFGVPSFVIDEEVFWGNDSIKYLLMYIENKDVLDKVKYQTFINKFQSL